jgi:hypothetical protein
MTQPTNAYPNPTEEAVAAGTAARIALDRGNPAPTLALPLDEPRPCDVRAVGRDDLWWTCQRTAGHPGGHMAGGRTWHDAPTGPNS